ncbi:hypothetical protein M0G74_17570 [Microbulbifer sp. CAU 1566]|uniref:hypothetical protein n=1 Tax=Microbulbifer sp. CAU 1566 TaxID=2933269 RepID=UPI002005F675|nr:hypothetical protein [Microbulbifer sp. CAU 1566]MCK7599087.1 hypothetical protein [Microbulbifer sp. CAU 1566]
MKKIVAFIPLLFTLNSTASQADDPCPDVALSIPVSKEIPSELEPPKFPTHGDRFLPGCVIVSFELAEMSDSQGGTLVPINLKIEAESHKKWSRSALKSVASRKYSAENVEYRGRQWSKLTFYLGSP